MLLIDGKKIEQDFFATRLEKEKIILGHPWLCYNPFSLIVPSYFSLILVVYLLGEVDVITPILLIFSFAPYLPFVSLTFLWT